MKEQTKTYVEYSYRGSFFDEETVTEVATRDISKLNVPDGAFAFIFYDIVEVVDGSVPTKSTPINYSVRYYYGGKVYTAKQVIKEFPGEHILKSNIVSNKWDKLIHCRTGNWQPFEIGDIHIPI